MRTIPYSDVLQRAAEASGRIYTDLTKQEAGLFKGFIGTRLRQIWEKWLWADLRLVEERKFRLEWYGGQNYNVTDEVFYTPTRKYYQSVKAANANNPPATGTPLAVNPAWWAEAVPSYSAADYDSTKAYAAGNQVFWPTTGRYYQCHTAAVAGVNPSDVAFWGVLTPFDQYIGWDQTGAIATLTPTPVGDVFNVYDRNPDIFAAAQPLTWHESANGIEVFTSQPTVWLVHRKRPPFLKGNTFDPTKPYSPGEQVYFSATSAAGNVLADFYDSKATDLSGANPPAAPGFWAKVEIPFHFGEWLIHAAAADMLSKDAKDDWSGDEMTLANESLLAELDKQERQKNQQPPLQVPVRGSVH